MSTSLSGQLDLLDEYLQAELARAPHWAEPPSKVRTSFRPPKVDYRAWLAHVGSCDPCAIARDDLAALRSGELESEPAVPCPIGMRLLPLVDVDFACPGFGRGDSREMLRRLVDHAHELDGWGPEVHASPGQAWVGHSA